MRPSRAEYHREWRERNKEKVRAYLKKYNLKHKARRDAEAKAWLKAHKDDLQKRVRLRYTTDPEFASLLKERARRWAKANREQINKTAREYQRRLRLEAIAAYGGKCVCCGEDHEEFLTFDHIHGGGNKERKSSTCGSDFCRKLKLLGYPKDKFRLLCFNCNCSIGIKGYCPHERERQSQAAD
jgi:hypothetical protein